MSEPPRYFTFEQASTIVELIKPVMGEILAIREKILARQPQFWPAVEKAAGNGGGRVASEVAYEFQRVDTLVRQILATGAILKDINAGLVDFPALRDGREVYLCWRYGEEQLAYWHEIDAGFAGRQLWTGP
jgi:hypothetical protein